MNILTEYTRKEAIAELERLTCERFTEASIKGLHVRGDGPPFVHRAGRCFYPRRELEEWAAARTLPNRHEWRTRREIAVILGLSWHTLTQMASYGSGPPFRKIGRSSYYNVIEALRWDADRKRKKAA